MLNNNNLPMFTSSVNVGFATLKKGNNNLNGLGDMDLIWAPGPNGSIIEKIVLQPLGTNVACVVRLFLGKHETVTKTKWIEVTVYDEVPNPAWTGPTIPNPAYIDEIETPEEPEFIENPEPEFLYVPRQEMQEVPDSEETVSIACFFERAIAATTLSTTAALASTSVEMNDLTVAPGYKIYGTVSVNLAAGIDVIVFSGDI